MKTEIIKKEQADTKIIARRAAKEISQEEMKKVSGGGYYGTDTGLRSGDDLEVV